MSSSASWLDRTLRNWAREQPAKTALTDGQSVTLTYAEVELITRAFAAEFVGGPVALSLPHGIPHALAILGLLRAGVAGVSLEVQASTAEHLELLRGFGISRLLCVEAHLDRYRKGSPDLVPVDLASGGAHAEVATLRSLSLGSVDAPALDSEHAWILLTTGSTGKRKGVVLRSEDLADRCAREREYLRFGRDSICFNGLHYAHDVGFTQLLSVITAGATLVVCPMIFPGHSLEILRKSRATAIWGSPFFWRQLLALAPGAEIFSDDVELATVSAGTLPVIELERLRAKLPRARLVRTFGQTETFRSFYSERSGIDFANVVPGAEIRLLDADGNSVPDGETGELHHSGTGSMAGYLAQGTKAFTSAREEIPTGDFFRRGPGGEFEFRGRRDDLIKCFDMRFFAVEVEREICAVDGVEECFVVLLPGEQLTAFLRTGLDPEAAMRAARERCRARMPLYKVPRRWEVLTEFPRTSNGKIDRQTLKENALARREDRGSDSD